MDVELSSAEGFGLEGRSPGTTVLTPPARGHPVCSSAHSATNKVARVLWQCVWGLLYRPSPKPLHGWRRLLLRLFGARMGSGVKVHPSARIWAPWNLQMDEQSCLGPHVDCYSVDHVHIGAYAAISQYSFLCTASHDVTDAAMRLTTAPIRIEARAWVAADVFVGPGVVIGAGAVVGARSSVFRDVEPWTIVGGNPARFLKARVIVSETCDSASA